MSAFAVPILPLDDVLPHPNADRLELAVLGGYRSIIPKGVYKPGDLVIYVPEGAIMPPYMLEREHLTDKLAGAAKNRVKAIKLRGVLSQGIVVSPLEYDIELGANPPANDNVAADLGIVKYEPAVPVRMQGQLGALHGFTKSYDFDNIKKRPHLFQPEDVVVLTEKLHGTYVQMGWRRDIEPNPELFGDGRAFVTSKGIAQKGLYIKNTPENAENIYLRTLLSSGLLDTLFTEEHLCDPKLLGVYVMGEIFGDVQDLKYGHAAGQTTFRLFDILMVYDDQEYFLRHEVLQLTAAHLHLKMVPDVTFGFWRDVEPRLEEFTRGQSLLDPSQIREGVVIKCFHDRIDKRYGRCIAKSVSEDYLLRKGDVTEMA